MARPRSTLMRKLSLLNDVRAGSVAVPLFCALLFHYSRVTLFRRSQFSTFSVSPVPSFPRSSFPTFPVDENSDDFRVKSSTFRTLTFRNRQHRTYIAANLLRSSLFAALLILLSLASSLSLRMKKMMPDSPTQSSARITLAAAALL